MLKVAVAVMKTKNHRCQVRRYLWVPVRQMTVNHAGYREEDHTQLPPPQGPQRPRFNPQIPSTGGTAINVDSFNGRNTDFNGVYNNNSQNYCEYEVSTQHSNLFLKFVKIKVVTVCLPTIGLDRRQDLITVLFQTLHFVVTFFHHYVAFCRPFIHHWATRKWPIQSIPTTDGVWRSSCSTHVSD